MDPIFHTSGSIKGIEVLFFEEAEVTRIKGSESSYATFGPLSVLYFADYHMFVLQINDWRYPILRTLDITPEGSGSYSLPAPNGGSFSLKITKGAPQGFSNFDNLLQGIRKVQSGPEDALMKRKQSAKKEKDTGVKEVISESIKAAVKKIENKVATAKTGTKYLTSTKKMVHLKDIKNKNFRKEAHSRIKKDFFSSSEKTLEHFMKLRKDNANMSESRDFDALKKSHGPVMYIPKSEIEEAIVNNKYIFNVAVPSGERRHMVPDMTAEKMPVAVEGMTHYQG